MIGGCFVGMQRIIVYDKVVPFADKCVGLIPAMYGIAFQNVCQFQVVVGVGLPACGRTDEYIELVFVQVVCVIYRNYPP